MKWLRNLICRIVASKYNPDKQQLFGHNAEGKRVWIDTLEMP